MAPPTAEAPALTSPPSSGGEDLVLGAALRLLQAAGEAQQAAAGHPGTPPGVRSSVLRAFEEAAAVLEAARTSPRPSKSPSTARLRRRPSVKEFLTVLQQEALEAAKHAAQESMEYSERSFGKARRLFEDRLGSFHMSEPMKREATFAVDMHDWFNAVLFLPIVLFNVWMWSCGEGGTDGGDGEMSLCCATRSIDLPKFWSGQAFAFFWWVTFAYFIADLIWAFASVGRARSSGVIIKHHFVTLIYMAIPYFRPTDGWLMDSFW